MILSEKGMSLNIPFRVINEKNEIESLAEVRIDENGSVNSIYSNGSAMVVGNVGLAIFANETEAGNKALAALEYWAKNNALTELFLIKSLTKFALRYFLNILNPDTL